MAEETKELVHQFEDQKSPKSNGKKNLIMGVVVLVIIGAGILSGYLLAGKRETGGINVITEEVAKGKEVGSKDTKAFPDNATGVIEKGGLDGEGTHKLIREGGPSQTVYLTSSTIDLDQFDGKKVEIWGETFRGQKAGWFMDVGRVKVIE